MTSESQISAATMRLLSVVRDVCDAKKSEIERIKHDARRQYDRPHFLWHAILQSFATMGNSRGQIGLIQTPAHYDRLGYERLSALDPATREQEVRAACRLAGVRMPRKQANWILAAFHRIEALGGPDAAKAVLLALNDRKKKQDFMQSFDGIGEKYSRNILMDAYEEHFRDSIAIDVRIENITAMLGLSFATYQDQERFYQGVARAAGIDGWDLDRLLYNFHDDIRARLQAVS